MQPPGLDNIRGKKITLGVCGGIAAYKAVEIARRLTQEGADVRVVLTPSAVNFVGALTFSSLTGNPVRSELFPQTVSAEIVHTDLGRTSDVILVAPATAKTIAKYARGQADDLMSAVLLSAACPVLLAPAMHSEMWEDESTQDNVAALKARGVELVGPATGPLAGPDSGIGRMADVEEILSATNEELALRSRLSDVHVVVTAGGTREPVDAVRYLGNRSSGKMGYELAREALRRGARVTLITAPSYLQPPAAARTVPVETAAQMQEAVNGAIEGADMLIMAAAVSDWRPAAPYSGKVSKGEMPEELKLERTADILEEIGARRSSGRLSGLRVLAGFCAETSDLESRAVEKLKAKGLDLVVANQVGIPGSGFDADTNRGLLVDNRGRLEEFPLIPKRSLARLVIDAAGKLFDK